MRVAILHQAVAPAAPLDEQDVLVQAEAVGAALALLGHQATGFGCTLDLEEADRWLGEARPDLVFNLVESLGGRDQLFYLAAGLLDARGFRYTGSPAESLMLIGNKLRAKRLLRLAGLPTPAWIEAVPVGVAADSGARLLAEPEFPGRFLLKPTHEHASLGMTDDAVVDAATSAGLESRLREHAARLGRACFAERFIEGREFNLSLLAGAAGPEVLPPAEIDFSAFPPGKPRIVGYDAKWTPGSFEFVHTPRSYPLVAEDSGLRGILAELSLRCWELFQLRGYARVDFRVDEAGQPWILEINANPCLSPDAGFAAALGAAGIGFDEALQRILEDVG